MQGADWARFPKPGDRLNGLTRTTLLEIVQDPTSGVKSAVIRKPGKQRGIRMLFLPSLFAYFERLAGVESDSQVTPFHAKPEPSWARVLKAQPVRSGT
jgi:hypothetical protein